MGCINQQLGGCLVNGTICEELSQDLSHGKWLEDLLISVFFGKEKPWDFLAKSCGKVNNVKSPAYDQKWVAQCYTYIHVDF